MTAITAVYATFADEEEAARIGKAVVEADLAACVNILGASRSIYRWQGKVEDTAEVAALFKTSADKVEALISRIASLHSYDLPAISAWPIMMTGPGYAEWVSTGQALGLR